MSKKITQLESATDVTASDFIQIVDIEDSDMAASGTNKKATAQLLANELGKLTNVTATGSTTARSLTNRFADVVNVKDFGAKGDGITDDTAAIQSALNAASVSGNCKAVYIDGSSRCLVNSADISIPRGVTLYGPHQSFGFDFGAGYNWSTTKGAIILNPAYTIKVNGNSSSLSGLCILRKGLTTVLSPSAAAAEIASFSGTAVSATSRTNFIGYGSISGNVLTISSVQSGAINSAYNLQISKAGQNVGISSFGTGTGGVGTYILSSSFGSLSNVTVSQLVGTANDDISITNLFIAGFNKGIYCNGANRVFVDNIKGDNINGLHITNSYDCSRISNVHFWPFVTAGNGTSTDLNYYRAGTGIDIDHGNDGTTVTSSFTYAYKTGFHIGCQNNATFTSCFVDSLATWFSSSNGSVVTTALGTVGVLCDSLAGSPIWHGGGIFAQAKGVVIQTDDVNPRDIMMFRNVVFAGNAVNHISQINSRLSCIGCSFQDLLGTVNIDVGVRVGSSATHTRLYNNVFNNNNPFAVSINDFEQTGNSFYGTAQGVEIWDEEQVFTDSTNPTQIAQFSYTSNGVTNGLRCYGAAGTPESPSVPTVLCNPWGIIASVYTGTGAYKGFSPMGGVRIGSRTTPSATNSDGTIIFSTTTTGATAQIDRLFIDHDGSFIPATDNSYTLGRTSLRWSSVWAANGTIQTSDERTKTDINESPLGLDFIGSLNPVSYKFKVGGNKVIRQVYRDSEGNEVDANADGANPAEIITEEIEGQRTHFGLIAQEVKAALPEGVDFGGWILTDKDDPDSEQGLRYEQFVAPLIKAVQELKARVEELESAP